MPKTIHCRKDVNTENLTFSIMTKVLDSPVLISDFEWTLERCHAAIENGTFRPEDKLELLNGKLIKKMSVSPPHASCLKKLSKYFNRRYLDVYELMSENPITIPGGSEPEPDVTIANLSADNYEKAHPNPDQVHLPIEVADKSLHRDRTHKAEIYAFAGIKKYWIVNIKQGQLELYLDPDTDHGIYGEIVRYKQGSTFDSPFVGSVNVDDLLPGK
jgi:Uma2 family endonuclease